MRFTVLAVLGLSLAACGSTPQPIASGPRIGGRLAAQWPTAGPARQAAFSQDGQLAALSDASGAIAIRDARDWKALRTLVHPGGATTVAFTRDGTALISGGYDGSLRFWDLGTGRQIRLIKASSLPIWTLDLSPDGVHMAAAGEDKIIRIWDVRASGSPTQLRGHGLNVWEVRFSPDGKRLASGSFDKSVRLWSVATGRQLKVLNGHTQAVVGLDFSPDGKLLVTGGDDAKIRYWRASDGKLLKTVDNGRHVDKIAFSPNGRWIATGGHPHGMIGELWHQLTGGGGEGDAVRIWRAGDGALVANLPHPDDTYLVVFSKDGRWLVTSGEDNRFRLWRLQPTG
jgi:WD40 repeat protein